MTDNCPCRGCTPETGRAPGCHSESCPHGWYEWDRQHKAERAARRAAKENDYALTEIAVTRQRKREKDRR